MVEERSEDSKASRIVCHTEADSENRTGALSCSSAIWLFTTVQPRRDIFDFAFCFSLFAAPMTSVEAIEGQQANLYCPMTTPTADKINMVLWFKDDVGVPIYR
jgi:hypothetical protein